MLVTAHGNSLRALYKFLTGMSEADIVELNIPTGIPLLFDLDAKLRPTAHRYLGDPAAAAAAAAAVARAGQGEARRSHVLTHSATDGRLVSRPRLPLAVRGARRLPPTTGAVSTLALALGLLPVGAHAARPSAEAVRAEAQRVPQRSTLPGLENLERQVTTEAGCAFADRDQVVIAVDDARAHPDFRHKAGLPSLGGDGAILLLSLEGRVVRLNRVMKGDVINGYRSADGRIELAIRLVRRHPWAVPNMGC